MKIRTIALAAIAAAAAFAGAAQANGYGYGYGYRGYGHVAPVYGGYVAPVCVVTQKKSFVYGYGWVYRDIRICR